MSSPVIYKSQAMTASRKIMRTQAEVVAAVGGPRAFKDRVGTARTAPYNYAAGREWPLHVLVRVIAIAAEDGFSLDPELTRRLSPRVLSGIANYVRRNGVV